MRIRSVQVFCLPKMQCHPRTFKKRTPCFRRLEQQVETAFYANNVEKIETVAEAYALAKETKGYHRH
jgi:hypothetical protein